MKRAGPQDYEQLAERCVEIASECSAPTVAEALRALAVDYLARAARLRHANLSTRQGRHRKRGHGPAPKPSDQPNDGGDKEKAPAETEAQ